MRMWACAPFLGRVAAPLTCIPMPGAEAHEQLGDLIADVHELIRTVQSQAASAGEVTLRATTAREKLDRLAATVGAGASGAFGTLGRHLYFLDYWYQRSRADSYAQDIVDLTERDLPGVIAFVGQWTTSGLDAGLIAATSTSWDAHHYSGAVRDAFVYLEMALREAGGVDPQLGLSGDKLVEALLGPNAPTPLALPGHGPFGTLTGGERAGAHHLLRGAFLLARNATAHRPIEYTRHQAEDLLHLVNLCLAVIRPQP
jgi:hypothetical protein